MKKIGLFIFLLFASSIAQQKNVCFTVDDLPFISYGIEDSSYQTNLIQKLVSSFLKNGIPAIGFVNEYKLYSENKLIPYKRELLEIWINNGLELGNHTYSHPDYNNTNIKEFGEEILKGEKNIKELVLNTGRELKFFRHPFLHTGSTKEKEDSLNDFLKSHGYITAPVTIDNADYLFAAAYKRAGDKQDTALQEKIGTDYVLYMEKKLKYFEKQAERLFGRNISQILLFHASALNADYADSLVQMFRNNGYQFISLQEALNDKAYESEISRYGRWGISWIDRWALSQGKKGKFFKDEPRVPEYINEVSR